jgi:adenosine kinase
MTVLVSGSLAYDRIMTFPGAFADHILPDKVHMLNVSFTVSGMVERPGGTAGNIAYALALLGERPRVLSTVGRDGQRLLDWLAQHGVDTSAILTVDDEFTASAYITTDRHDNQITGFNPGAMRRQARLDLSGAVPEASIAVIGPGNLDDMRSFRKAYVQRGIPFIFDPGQSLPLWDGVDLAEALTGAAVLISNDYEFELVRRKTGLNTGELLTRVGAIITTRAEHGSVVITKERSVAVPAYPVGKALVDPTGAGDAYRGGLVKGLLLGKSLAEGARMGTVCASFCVQVQGTQEYRFTEAEFRERFRALG